MDSDSTLSAVSPGAECVSCGKANTFEHRKGELRHCFSCGENTLSTTLTDVDAVVDVIFQASHQQLLASPDVRSHLIHERKLHPQVVIDSAIGVIPSDLDLSQLFMPAVEAAETELQRVLALPRNPGRPSKDERFAIVMATRGNHQETGAGAPQDRR